MKRKSTLNFSHASLFIGFTEVIFWTIFTIHTKEALRAKLMYSITNSEEVEGGVELFCIQLTNAKLLSVWIYKKGTSRIFRQQFHLRLLQYLTIFFLWCFQYKKPLTSGSRQKTFFYYAVYIFPHPFPPSPLPIISHNSLRVVKHYYIWNQCAL